MNINKMLREWTAYDGCGSDMGRPSYCKNETATVECQKVDMQDGCYDLGGAYWGMPDDLWCVADANGEVMLFQRAHDRGSAIAAVLKQHPRLTIQYRKRYEWDYISAIEAYVAFAVLDFNANESDGDAESDEADAGELAVEARVEAQVVLETFIKQHSKKLLTWDDSQGSLDSQVGHDLWASRNGHGVGFWESEWGEFGASLHEAARALGETSLYRGDDGLLYFG